ncbi:MAG: hypothetical protein ACRDJM_00245 [Actinomycetota bacterium]
MSRIALTLALAALAAGCRHDDDSGAGAAPPLPDTVMDRGTDPFVFRTDSPEAYVRVDRMGVAAVATLVLPAGATRDQFNFGEPQDDGNFSGQIVPRLNKIHFELDDDLVAAGLAPCPLDVCIQQAVPGIVPDVIHLTLAEPDGFPNARTLDDPVVDRLVAIALLDLTTPGDCNGAPCTVSTFEDLPLNPPANEVPLLPDFPYFGLPHPPPP